MKMKLQARDKNGSWHGQKVYTLSLYMESLNSETRDRVWTAIEKALPDPEERPKAHAMGMRAEE